LTCIPHQRNRRSLTLYIKVSPKWHKQSRLLMGILITKMSSEVYNSVLSHRFYLLQVALVTLPQLAQVHRRGYFNPVQVRTRRMLSALIIQGISICFPRPMPR
jgi:hypothetical protein